VGFILWCLLRVWRALRTKGTLALPLAALALFAAATGAGYSSVFILPLAVAMSIARSGRERILAGQVPIGASIPTGLGVMTGPS
jgi:hypothetical protein